MKNSQSKSVTGESKGPLEGLRVVSCSTAQAGTVPYMLMADLGADVIKIETPGAGDRTRNQGIVPGYPSSYFETNNRGVRSLTLNLKDPRGQEILHQLVAKATTPVVQGLVSLPISVSLIVKPAR